MKNFSIIHILLVLIAVLAYQCVNAQDYLVNTKGDTLRGEIKIFNWGPDKKVQVLKDKKKNQFPIFQIKTFSYENEIYQPVKGPEGYTFMKLIKAGYLSLYAYQLQNQVSYDGLYLTKKDGTGAEVPNLGFKKTMKRFLTECPSVAYKLENDEFSRKDLHVLVDEFNICIDTKSTAQEKVISIKQAQTKKINHWDNLYDKVNALADFNGKGD